MKTVYVAITFYNELIAIGEDKEQVDSISKELNEKYHLGVYEIYTCKVEEINKQPVYGINTKNKNDKESKVPKKLRNGWV